MSDILNVVSFSTVRAVLGISETDAPDEVMSAFGLTDDLKLDLSEWLEDYQAILANTWTGTAANREYIYPRVVAYTKYQCAGMVCKALPGLMLKRISDGENESQRFDGIKFEKIAEQMFGQAGRYREQIENRISSSTATATVNFFGVVAPDYDPVVGE